MNQPEAEANRERCCTRISFTSEARVIRQIHLEAAARSVSAYLTFARFRRIMLELDLRAKESRLDRTIRPPAESSLIESAIVH